MKRAKILITAFCLMAFAITALSTDTAFAVLIFDGSFGPEDKWTGERQMYGNWTSAIVCYPDEAVTVQVSSIGFGGRSSGYATKFTNINGRECFGGHHNQLTMQNILTTSKQVKLPDKTVTVGAWGVPFYAPDKSSPRNEYWIGWSQMIDTWTMTSGWAMFGPGDANLKYNTPHTSTIDPNVFTETEHEHNDMGVIPFVMPSTSTVQFHTRRNAEFKGEKKYPGVLPKVGNMGSGWFEKRVWYDFLVRAVFSADLSQNGIVELWGRKNGNSEYTKIYSNYSVLTWDQHQDSGNSREAYQWRFGIYSEPITGGTQSIYLANYKLGTTRVDVEYRTIPLPAHCSNAAKDSDETGIDCGGSCIACYSDPSPATSLILKPGWNQISSPIAAGINLATIESSCTILQYKNQKLWAWNATSQVWLNPAKVESFKGYWIYTAYQCTVPLSGTQTAFTSLPLSVGWNKISASGMFSAIQGTCANHITGNWVWHWDKSTEKWIHPTTMQLDKGYWIKVDQNCILGV